jgi:pimeloyl-ACP methyl ester carboxylesterase
MKKIKIKNRKGQTIVVLVEKPKKSEGLAFIAHGLGGFKEQSHIQTFTEAFKDAGHTTIRWDATNSIGESDGKMENATLTNYYEDMQDVIKWSRKQSWYQQPFILCGHSLGSGCCILYAIKNPSEVKALAPISTFLSGKFDAEVIGDKGLKEWKKKGFIIQESTSKPGVIKRLEWRLMEDLLKYDLLKIASKLTMPTLLIVGEDDLVTKPEHHKLLVDAIPAKHKELHTIKGAPHTFIEAKHLRKIKKIMSNWIAKINA